VAILVGLFFSLSTAGLFGAQNARDAVQDVPRIALASAFADELAPLLNQVQDAQQTEIDSVVYTTGTLAGEDVVLFTTGVSMVNAAMNTQRTLDHFTVTHLLYMGIAGGLAPGMALGDVVIPAQWGQYQESVYTDPDPADSAISSIPFPDAPTERFAFISPKPLSIRGKPTWWFDADPTLLRLVTPQSGRLIGGRGVSGQAYVDYQVFGQYLYRAYGAQVVDMESAAVAQVAYANQVPFLIVRGVSDLPGMTDAAVMQAGYRTAAANAAAVVAEVVAALVP
jgi:adenosylhomocysteine nucleosidase